MKNLFTLCTVLLVLASQFVSAQTIRRVNQYGITGPNIYTSIQAAHDASAAGDIIQVEASQASYSGFTCSKAVTIVGTGYFLDQNQPPVLQVSPYPSVISGTVYFNSGSAGAVINGLTITTLNVVNGVTNVTIQRNNIGTLNLAYIYNSGNSSSTVTTSTASNLIIRQNYISTLTDYQINYQYYPYNALNSYTNSNLVITNNIITGGVYLTSGSNLFPTNEFSNNVVLGSSSFDNWLLHNNYFGAGLSTTISTDYTNNLLGQASQPTAGFGSNNTTNVTPSSIFMLSPGSSQFDGWYQLKSGSNPARSGGVGGTDIGAFGGISGYPYILSGTPAIPSIYQFNDVVNGNTLNISVSTRANK